MFRKIDRSVTQRLVARCLAGSWAVGFSLMQLPAMDTTALAQETLGGIRAVDQAPPPAFPSPPISPLDCLARPCPPSVESCPPAGYPCYLESASGTQSDAFSGVKSWLFRRYAGSYEMKTKLPYPEGYRGSYYFRAWVPGYVRREADDFQPGYYDRPFYHHVDFYPHEACYTGVLHGPVEAAIEPIRESDPQTPLSGT